MPNIIRIMPMVRLKGMLIEIVLQRNSNIKILITFVTFQRKFSKIFCKVLEPWL